MSIIRECLQVVFLVSSVWRGVSASGMGCGDGTQDKGLHRRTVGLKLVRLDSSQSATPANLILLKEEEATEFHELGLQKWQKKYPQVSRFIHNALDNVNGIFGEFA